MGDEANELVQREIDAQDAWRETPNRENAHRLVEAVAAWHMYRAKRRAIAALVFMFSVWVAVAIWWEFGDIDGIFAGVALIVATGVGMNYSGQRWQASEAFRDIKSAL